MEEDEGMKITVVGVVLISTVVVVVVLVVRALTNNKDRGPEQAEANGSE